MKMALAEAELARSKGEIPVGALILLDGEVIGWGHNSSIELSDPTAHAEIQALRTASETKQNYRLSGSTLYVTLEPCLMCIGAILHARVDEVIVGAREPASQTAGTFLDALESGWLNHRCKVTVGICEEESAAMLKEFFLELR